MIFHKSLTEQNRSEMLFTLLCLIFCLFCAGDAMWMRQNVRVLLNARQCFHEEHVRQLDSATLCRDVDESKYLQALALDQWARLLTTGMPFCVAFREALFRIESKLQYQIAGLEALGEEGEELLVTNGWSTTYELLKNATLHAEAECVSIDSKMEVGHPKKHTSILSSLLECLNRHRKKALSAKVKAAFE